MWIRQVFLGILGLSSGFAVAGGMFAFLIALGVVARFAEDPYCKIYSVL